MTIISDLLTKLAGFAEWLYNFCTMTIKIGSWNVNILALFGGAGLTVLVIAGLVKALVPLT